MVMIRSQDAGRASLLLAIPYLFRAEKDETLTRLAVCPAGVSATATPCTLLWCQSIRKKVLRILMGLNSLVPRELMYIQHSFGNKRVTVTIMNQVETIALFRGLLHEFLDVLSYRGGPYFIIKRHRF